MPPISNGTNLVSKVEAAYKSRKIRSLVDKRMRVVPGECVERFATLALWCCHDQADARPPVDQVVRELETICNMAPETQSDMPASSSYVSTWSRMVSGFNDLYKSAKSSFDVSGSNLLSVKDAMHGSNLLNVSAMSAKHQLC